VILTIAFIVWVLIFKKIKLTPEQIKKRINTKKQDPEKDKKQAQEIKEVIIETPTTEDIELNPKTGLPLNYKTLRSYLHPVTNQGECSSCTAFATIQAISTNYAFENDTTPETLSPMLLLSCRHKELSDDVCEGYRSIWWLEALTGKKGFWKLPEAFSYIPLLEDLPYTYADCIKNIRETTCIKKDNPSKTCTKEETTLDLDNRRGYKVKEMITVSTIGDPTPHHINNIQKAIMRYGAVTAGFPIFENFYLDSSVPPYKYTPDINTEYYGGHAIILVGWTTEGYWWVQNSWGSYEHNNGHFLMKWGSLMNVYTKRDNDEIYTDYYFSPVLATVSEKLH
tara:strand:+ start:2029 stop:3042 length:1014 start_codon:yes stop_codon:yes gene_type:complete